MTWEVEERKAEGRGGEGVWGWVGCGGGETDRNKQREGEREGERERGRLAGRLAPPAPASHLSLAVLTPQLLLVQSTVTGREPARELRKTPTQPLHTQREAKKKRNVFGRNKSLRPEPSVA